MPRQSSSNGNNGKGRPKKKGEAVRKKSSEVAEDIKAKRSRPKLHQPEGEPATNGTAARPHGRLASSLTGAALSWFVEGWFASSLCNVLVGRKNVGKSSCLAWLLSQARRPVILPGREESVELMMLPRWRAARVKLDRLLILNDRDYYPSLQVALLVEILRHHRADLLVVENLDSYLPPEASTNDSQSVRPYLEALHAIASESGVCLVGTRHPGKNPGNLCPGSHEWEDVPRITVVLEREDRHPPVYWMYSHRCGVGRHPDPLGYTLATRGSAPPVFAVARETDRVALQMAQAAPDLLDRSRLQAAIDLLTALLGDDWVEAKVVFAEASKEALGEGTVRRAAGILQVKMRREGQGLGHKSFWGRHNLDLPWTEEDQK